MAIKKLKHTQLTAMKNGERTIINPVDTHKNLKFKTILLMVSGMYASTAFALEPFVVKDIRVEGIQRTEAGTVFTVSYTHLDVYKRQPMGCMYSPPTEPDHFGRPGSPLPVRLHLAVLEPVSSIGQGPLA